MPNRLTINEACKRLGVTRRTLYNLIDRGALPFVRIGTHRMFDETALQAYLDERDRPLREAAEIESGRAARWVAEAARLEAARLEAARLEAARLEAARLEADERHWKRVQARYARESVQSVQANTQHPIRD